MAMVGINLTEFIEKTRLYQGFPYGYEKLYQATKSNDVWNHLSEINERQTREVILKFVNTWKCRLSYDCAPNLTKALKESAMLLAKFNSYNLLDINPDFFGYDNSIPEAFTNIASVSAKRRTVGSTAASKILHMANPNFFVMSDDNIRHAYGCYDNGLGYLNFMWRMKLFGDALMKEYMAARKVSKEDAFQSLKLECKSNAPTLAKLLDEYNWVKYNP